MSQKTILIAEDENTLRKALGTKLKNTYRVIEATNGEEAYDTAIAEKPDLILLDQLMPKFTGLAVLKRLRKDDWGKDVPVIVTTNVAEGTQSYDELAALSQKYLVKSNVSLEEIIDAIEELIG